MPIPRIVPTPIPIEELTAYRRASVDAAQAQQAAMSRVIIRQEELLRNYFEPPSAVRDRPRHNTMFTPTEYDIEFWRRVYHGATFEVGTIYNHTDFIVITTHAAMSEVHLVMQIREAVGITYHGSEAYRAQHRPKLPREPVEALPLPG